MPPASEGLVPFVFVGQRSNVQMAVFLLKYHIRCLRDAEELHAKVAELSNRSAVESNHHAADLTTQQPPPTNGVPLHFAGLAPHMNMPPFGTGQPMHNPQAITVDFHTAGKPPGHMTTAASTTGKPSLGQSSFHQNSFSFVNKSPSAPPPALGPRPLAGQPSIGGGFDGGAQAATFHTGAQPFTTAPR